MLIFKIALRNLVRQRRRTFFTALSMIVGFVLASLFIAWADGSYNYIIDNFTRNRLGHIQIHKKGYLNKPTLYKTVGNYRTIEKKLKNTENVTDWTPRIFTGGLVSVEQESSGAQITGIDPKREKSTTNIHKKIIKGDYFSEEISREVLLGKGLAEFLEANIEDKLVIVSQAADGSIANDAYTVKGILDLGDDMSNRTSVYMKIDQAQKLFVLNNRIHEIAINVNSLKNVEVVSERLKQKISDKSLSIETWKEFAKSFYRAMKADMEGMWISLLVVIIVVAIGVLNTVLMSVLERRREYGVLKALGTKPGQIIKMVLYETSVLAVISIIIGTMLALIVNYIFSKHGIALPNPIEWGGMRFEYMKGEINLRSYVIPAITVFLSGVVVSFFPAVKAAKTKAAEVMRMF
ncbi:MAG: ABC transporter permease [Kosmotoga sp.]|nr:MAG: ABC transporter permease [Kosmotoga sp.]